MQGRGYGRSKKASKPIKGTLNQHGALVPMRNFQPGQKASPVMLLQWLLKLKDKITETCPKLNIKNLICDDGTLHEYIVIPSPDAPADATDRIQVNECSARFNMVLKRRDDYRSTDGSITIP